MQDRPDDPEGAPAPFPRTGKPRWPRKKKPRHPWTGLPAVPVGAHAFAPGPAERALFVEVPGFHFVFGLDRDGRLVGAAIFTGNTRTGHPDEGTSQPGEGKVLQRFGWGG